MYSPQHDHPQTLKNVERWFFEAGLKDVGRASWAEWRRRAWHEALGFISWPLCYAGFSAEGDVPMAWCGFAEWHRRAIRFPLPPRKLNPEKGLPGRAD